MTGPNSPETSETPLTDPPVVRQALARVLAADGFKQSESLTRLLRFAVEESLAGRRCKVKDSPAAELRTSLSEYYAAEGARDPVRIHLPLDGSAPVFSSVAPTALRRPRRWWLWMAPALLAVILLTVWAGAQWRARAASAQIRSVALLPLVDLGPRKDAAWLCDGTTRGIIDALGRVPGLRVSAAGSAFAFRDKAADLARIGQTLGAAAVIQGTLQQAGGRLLINLRMTRASDGYQLWTERFDRSSQDAVATPQAIAAAIAARLQIPAPKSDARRHQPPPEAFRAYLEGRSFFDQSNPALDKAVERLEESVHVDPQFAEAWAWLSISREYRVAAAMARSNQAMPASRDAAERAAALDPECSDAHLALGIVSLQYDWDWATAKTELDRALQASPGSAFALQWHAHWFETQGRLEEAMTEMQRALALDPLSPVLLGHAVSEYLSLKQTDRALPLARKAIELSPDDTAARLQLARVLYYAGQKEQSAQIIRDLRDLPPPVLGEMAAQAGDNSAAHQLLDQAEDLSEEQLLPAVTYAQLAGAMHDWNRFFLWVDEAYGERDVHLPYLRLNPTVPKSDPRFAAFLAQMNLPPAP